MIPIGKYIDAVCGHYRQLWMIFSIAAVFFLVSLVLVIVHDPGTPANAVSVFNLFTMAGFMAFSGFVIVNCIRRGET